MTKIFQWHIVAAFCLATAFALPLAASAGGIGGSVNDTFAQVASCRNTTTGQTVSIPGLGGGPAWDCSTAGLAASSGDNILQIVRGQANCGGGACNIGGTASGVDPAFALCRNLNTAQSTIVPLGGAISWDCAAAGFNAAQGEQILQVVRGTALSGGPLPACSISFDGACPNQGAICGASFSGGVGCVVDGLGACYSTGAFGYAIDPGQVVMIALSGDLLNLDVFFAHTGALGSGTMTFLDAGGNTVGAPLMTNGDCTGIMPPDQVVSFATPVRTVMVENNGPTRIYIDTFSINP